MTGILHIPDYHMMPSWHGNAFCISGSLWGESIGHHTDAELWCFSEAICYCGRSASLLLSPCHTRVASSRRLHGVQEKLRTPRCAQWDLLERRGIAVASPLDAVGPPWTPCHGAHFVHAQSARRGSAFPRRSEWAPCERSGFAAATQ